MRDVRHFLAQRHLAVLLCVATLALKLLIPTGYMIDGAAGGLSLTVCSGVMPAATMTSMPAMHGHASDHGKPGDHGKAEMPCAFAGLSAATLDAIDPIQLAALIAFILAFARIATLLPAPSSPARLRPPLRGPPAYR